MQRLKTGDRIKLENGHEAVVVKFLGEGAQGAVYSVNVDGDAKALKWFRKLPNDTFLKNIRKNINDGAPSPLFLWPEALSRVKNGCIGYIMPLKPIGSHEFSKFRLAKVRFSSFHAIVEAALNLCDAFRLLHASGLSYQDLNDGGFFINPDTGDIRICDCDNVYPHGENSGILGKARYMAPEIVMGKSLPNSYTDRFSLTVILFMLFCIDHPFEGFNIVKRPCLTEVIEQRLFGPDICFIYNKDNDSNRPVRGIHHNVITMWPLLPDLLKNTFIEQFSDPILNNPPERMTEMQWIDIFITLRDHLTKCPHCGDETFVFQNMSCINSRCKKQIDTTFFLEGAGRSIPLIKGNVLRFNRDPKPSGIVIEKPGHPEVLLIKNLGLKSWTVLTPSGKSLSIAPNGFMPVKQNLIISTSIKLTINK